MTGNPLDSIRRRYDERAETYDESDMHRAVAQAVARFVAISGVEAVLDVATGTGLALRALRERFDASTHTGPRLVGVDLSPGMLAVARRELPGATFLQGDAAALPLPNASFDLITCVTALHVIPDWQAAVREWRRVLKPGGRVVSATFTQADRGRQRPNVNPYPVNHAPFVSATALGASVGQLGFSLARSEVFVHGVDEVLLAEFKLANQSHTWV